MAINKVNYAENSTNSKILDELRKIREAITDGKHVRESGNNVQSNSPYAPDRKSANNYQILNSAEETKWKEVMTYDQMGYQQLIKVSSDEEQRKAIHDTIKKLNII